MAASFDVIPILNVTVPPPRTTRCSAAKAVTGDSAAADAKAVVTALAPKTAIAAAAARARIT